MIEKRDLPEGAYTRYLKDIWGGKGDFNEFLLKYEKEREEKAKIRNTEHPIEYNYKFQLTPYESVSIFKRKGEDWHCSECDMSPAGGCGDITLKEALDKISENLNSQYEPESLIFCERKMKKNLKY